jgi:hypothetical protein
MECVEGSEGPLCGACKEGWRYSSQDRKCELCLASSFTWFQVFIHICISSIILFYSNQSACGHIFITIIKTKQNKTEIVETSYTYFAIHTYIYNVVCAIKLLCVCVCVCLYVMHCLQTFGAMFVVICFACFAWTARHGTIYVPKVLTPLNFGRSRVKCAHFYWCFVSISSFFHVYV